jgi:hypothetical protein
LIVPPGITFVAAVMLSVSVAVTTGANIGDIGVMVRRLAILVSGFVFVTLFDKLKFVGLSAARFVFLEAETTKVISVAAATKEMRTSAN